MNIFYEGLVRGYSRIIIPEIVKNTARLSLSLCKGHQEAVILNAFSRDWHGRKPPACQLPEAKHSFCKKEHKFSLALTQSPIQRACSSTVGFAAILPTMKLNPSSLSTTGTITRLCRPYHRIISMRCRAYA